MERSSVSSAMPWRLLLVLAVASDCAALEALQAPRAAREPHLGPAILVTPEYTVHSPQAVVEGGGFRCELPQSSAMSDAEFNTRREAILASFQAQRTGIEQERLALMNGQRRTPQALSAEDYRARVDALTARETALGNQAYEQERQLQEEHRQARVSAARPLTLRLLHTPDDPGRTIVPLDSFYPAQPFVAELSRSLRRFLASCGDTSSVGTYHYWRDVIPFGAGPGESGIERPIISYGYSLKGGMLTLQPSRETEVWKQARDPVRNPELTLSRLVESNAASLAEQSRRNADYRKDHLVAAKRRTGIVYKLDAYWAPYRKPDVARRIFDGDFANYAQTAEFGMLYLGYANLFSSRCASEVKSFALLPESVSTNHRSELDPVTGLWTPTSDRKVVVNRMDARFAGRYRYYESGLENAYMARILGQMKEAERGERKRATEWTAADFAAAVTAERDHLQDLQGIFPSFFERHACSSATMRQLGENLVRAADRQPSVQEAGMRFAGAERESDPASR